MWVRRHQLSGRGESAGQGRGGFPGLAGDLQHLRKADAGLRGGLSQMALTPSSLPIADEVIGLGKYFRLCQPTCRIASENTPKFHNTR